MIHDFWLHPWTSTIVAAAAGKPVLEIGCGPGDDTASLINMGVSVVAFDLDPEEVARATAATPAAVITVQSVLDPFPLEGQGIGVVVAGLSLHYFSWADTEAIVQRVRGTLRPGGLFLIRVNSDQDINYGAVGHPRIEPGFYSVNGQRKRFFSEHDIDSLFQVGWRLLSKKHVVSNKYQHPKALWEVALERDA